MKRLNIILFLLALAVLTVEAKDLKVAGIFGDNMVLQQKTVTPIWGWADAGTTVTVTSSWNDKSYSARERWYVENYASYTGSRRSLCINHNGR